jgi:hypothetical protein
MVQTCLGIGDEKPMRLLFKSLIRAPCQEIWKVRHDSMHRQQNFRKTQIMTSDYWDESNKKSWNLSVTSQMEPVALCHVERLGPMNGACAGQPQN